MSRAGMVRCEMASWKEPGSGEQKCGKSWAKKHRCLQWQYHKTQVKRCLRRKDN
jgi:hypothetical protein